MQHNRRIAWFAQAHGHALPHGITCGGQGMQFPHTNKMIPPAVRYNRHDTPLYLRTVRTFVLGADDREQMRPSFYPGPKCGTPMIFTLITSAPKCICGSIHNNVSHRANKAQQRNDCKHHDDQQVPAFFHHAGTPGYQPHHCWDDKGHGQESNRPDKSHQVCNQEESSDFNLNESSYFVSNATHPQRKERSQP